jgi:hypothetical protein
LTAHAGVAGTVALNALAAPTVAEIPWHVTAPIVWSVLVELTARTVLGEWRAQHKPTLDRVPARLWVTAPVESARVWLRLARRVEGDQAAARLEVGAYAAAVEALRASIPGRQGRAARRILRRQLRAGTLAPSAVLASCGWLAPTSGPRAPQAVLRAALGAALGQDEAGLVTVEVVAVRALDAPATVQETGAAEAVPEPAPALEPAAPASGGARAVLEPVAPEKPVGIPTAKAALSLPAIRSRPEPVRVPVAAARQDRSARVVAAVDSPGAGRSLDDLRDELTEAIRTRALDGDPSAEAIRRHLRIGAARARRLRAELRA